MKKLSLEVEKYLTSLNWSFQASADSELFDVGTIKTENGLISLRIRCDEKLRTIIVHSMIPVATPDKAKSKIYDLLNRINDTIILGRICMDPEDGIISNRTCSIYPGTEISQEAIYHLINSNIYTLDHYVPAIMDVFYNHNIPALAFLERN